ncbi:MAG: TonB-dependent receptor [Calditrichaeota bacterium]|nr:TonB-dependent receptor [Calditrichota bacterium]
MKPFIVVVFLMGMVLGALAQTGTVSGVVTDADTQQPLIGANVVVKNTHLGASTDEDGYFRIENLSPGAYTLVISYIGYREAEVPVDVRAGETTEVQVALQAAQIPGDVVVVTATRGSEKVVDAPATINVLTARDFELIPTYNYELAFATMKGVDFVRTGVDGVGLNARGFNSAFNTKVLLLTDNRISMMPGTGLPAGNMNPVIKEDINTMEVVLGPASALYGANAHNGIVNVITRDPRNFRGTTLALSVGNQDVKSGRLYHAGVLGKFAYKLTGEYSAGTEFKFVDTVYVGQLAVPETPDFKFEHIRGSASLYYRLFENSDLIASYGRSVNSGLGVTNNGRNQIKDWVYEYAQLRFVSPHLFAQVYRTSVDAGKTHSLRNKAIYMLSGLSYTDAVEKATFIDRSSTLFGEIQFNQTIAGFGITLGANYQKDMPVSEGTYLADTGNVSIDLVQYGVVAQVDRRLFGGWLRAIGAVRYDYHENYGTQISPKAGLVLNALNGAFRVTFGRGYVAPTILHQELYIPISAGFILRGNGDGFTLLDGTKIDPLKPETVDTWEVGYKGAPVQRLYLDVNAYYSRNQNFISPLNVIGVVKEIGGVPVAPTVVMTYLNFGEVNTYGADLAAEFAVSSNITLRGTFSYFGSNLDTARTNPDGTKYWDINKDGKVTPNEISLNTPTYKWSLTLLMTDVFLRNLTTAITIRGVAEYDMVSGIHMASATGVGTRLSGFNFNYGPLGGFTTVGISAGYRVNQVLTLGFSASNIFNVEQREFVGSPSIGRLMSLEARVSF